MATGAPLDYWSGLVSGFSGRREAALTRNLEEDRRRREQEGQIFSYLLQSNDPEMRALALSGLFETAQPGRRRKGLSGFLGEVEGGQVYPLVRSRMEELVPDEGPPRPQLGGPAPLSLGAAAMPTNQPVRAGSQPIGLPGQLLPPEQPPVTDTTTGVTAAMPPDLEGMGGGPVGMGGPPPPPPASKFKRRGTGVPTAEEIAEMQARVPLQTRIGMARQQLSEDDARRAILGILGAPQTARQFAAPTFAVEDPINGNPVPVAFDYTTGRFYFTDGTEVPRGARFVRMGGGGGAGLSSYVEDTPEQRQQLQQAYPDLVLPPGVSPTGYLRLQVRPDGTAMAIPAEWTPPPAYLSTPTILNQAGTATVAGVPRGGGSLVPLGTAPSPQPSVEQSSAQALLADVEKRIAAAETPRMPGMPRRPLLPAQRDQIVREAARAAQLPYQTYFELQQATRVPTARQVPPLPSAPPSPGPTVQPPATPADRIRQRALEIERGGGRAAPPPAPPARSRQAGPRR